MHYFSKLTLSIFAMSLAFTWQNLAIAFEAPAAAALETKPTLSHTPSSQEVNNNSSLIFLDADQAEKC